MRSISKALAAAGVGLLALPSFAVAGNVEDQIQVLQERLSQLETQLQATNDDLQSANARVAAQQVALEDAGIDNPRGSSSSLSAFLEQTDFSGWVEASYNFNTANENNSTNNQNSTVFFPDSNTFQVGQVWLEMDKAPTAESRGGFHIDLLFGKDASTLGGNFGGNGNDGVEIFTAYVSYLAPIGGGIQIDAGELPTLIGAEVVQTTGNFNITRGFVWGLQPITHTGVIISSEYDSGFSWAAGFVNDPFSDSNTDANNGKGFTAQLAYGTDMFGASVNGIYGSTNGDVYGLNGGGNENQKFAMIDVVLTADPSDNLSLWANFDWQVTRDEGGIPDTDIFGLALAGRLAVTDSTGIALRGEVVWDDEGVLGTSDDEEIYSLTLTADHALTDNLMVRGEARWNHSSDEIFRNSSGVRDMDDELILFADLVYTF
ncbi:MAG: porin [Proteobacteria bacterium]|nr:porin [Pseudomonadota bacterium]